MDSHIKEEERRAVTAAAVQPLKPPRPTPVSQKKEVETTDEETTTIHDETCCSVELPSSTIATRIVRAMTMHPPLAPVAVVPCQLSRAMEIHMFLSRIEHIEIREVMTEQDDKVTFYILDIYRYQHQTGIPTRKYENIAALSMRTSSCESIGTNRSSLSGSVDNHLQHHLAQHHPRHYDHRLPDYQIAHRYSTFSRLRSKIWEITGKRHPRGLTSGSREPCKYCTFVRNFLRYAPAQPNLKVKFMTTTEARKEILSTFINELVDVTCNRSYLHCRRSLRGYHQIPAMLKRFLTEQNGENFMAYC